MAAEYIAIDLQDVLLNNPILYQASIPCRKGYVFHQNGNGVFILKGKTDQCFATYEVEARGNIAIPEGGALTPIALSIIQNGEVRKDSLAIFTPTAVDVFGFVSAKAIIQVPRGCCIQVSSDYVSASTDPTTTPTPLINTRNMKFIIKRTA